MKLFFNSTLALAVAYSTVSICALDTSKYEANPRFYKAVVDSDGKAAEQALKDGAGVNYPETRGLPTLTALVIQEDKPVEALELARLLIQKGVNLDAQMPDGVTALHAAVMRQDVPFVRLLVAAGANTNAEMIEGKYTPLMVLLMMPGWKSMEILELLLAHGADVTKRNAEGANAIHLAVIRGDKEPLARVVDALAKKVGIATAEEHSPVLCEK